MSRVSFGRLLPVAVGLLVACTDPSDPVHAPGDPSFAIVEVSGRVLDQAGNNICDSYAPGTGHRLSFFKVRDAAVDSSAGGTVTMTCPANTWTRAGGLEEGRYVVRITTNFGPDSTSHFPRNAFDTITVAGASSTLDVVVPAGVAIGGRALLNGVPFAGAQMSLLTTLSDALNTNFGAIARSRADGTWGETVPFPAAERSRVYLQPGLEYQSFGCLGVRGARQTVPPLAPFTADAATRIFCRYRDAANRRWTHTATQLDVTPGAGGIQAFEPDADGGMNFGVQYPSTDTVPDRGFAPPTQHLFAASFVVAFDGDSVVLTANDAGTALACSASCDDLEPTSMTPAAPRTGPDAAGLRVTWQVSDSLSPEARGVRITQVSYDGSGGDYVLFRLRIENTSGVRRDFRIGFAADWDVSISANGATGTVDGIAWSTNNDTGSPFLGSTFIGSFAELGYFGYSGTLSVANQRLVMRDDLSNAGLSNIDVRYLQSVGPIRIRAGGARTVWFALLAGQTLGELQANAATAAADVVARTTP